MTLEELRKHHAHCAKTHRDAANSYKMEGEKDEFYKELERARLRDAAFHDECIAALDTVLRPRKGRPEDRRADAIDRRDFTDRVQRDRDVKED